MNGTYNERINAMSFLTDAVEKPNGLVPARSLRVCFWIVSRFPRRDSGSFSHELFVLWNFFLLPQLSV